MRSARGDAVTAKHRREQYRAAARRLYHVTVPLHADVAPAEGGAFVEAVVWVPADEAEIERPEADYVLPRPTGE